MVISPHTLPRKRGGEEPLEPTPCTPPALLSLLPLLLISLLRVSAPADLIHDFPPIMSLSLYKPALLTCMVMTMSEGHGLVSDLPELDTHFLGPSLNLSNPSFPRSLRSLGLCVTQVRYPPAPLQVPLVSQGIHEPL